LNMIDGFLDRLDLSDSSVNFIISSQRPSSWSGLAPDLQESIILGLQSSVTSPASFSTLKKLAKIPTGDLIGDPSKRLRNLFTACLPWFLQAMDDGSVDDLAEMALDVSKLADSEGCDSVQRVMVSFVKSRFRTRDDFLRQAVTSLRDCTPTAHTAAPCILLLGILLNSHRWIRLRAMEVLKLLFQPRDHWNPVELAGSEHLTPLLRLLPTDLASHALDVLDQPILLRGGSSAANVIRQSVQSLAPNPFGPSLDTNPTLTEVHRATGTIRANIMAVFDTCKMPERPSVLFFEQEESASFQARNRRTHTSKASLGQLLSNLHDLNNYFQEDEPNQEAETKVQAILARSLASKLKRSSMSSEEFALEPPTPFIGLFSAIQTDPQSGYFDSEESDSDIEQNDSKIGRLRSGPPN